MKKKNEWHAPEITELSVNEDTQYGQGSNNLDDNYENS